MNQYKILMYVGLSILTGSMGVMFFAISRPDSTLNFKVMGCVLLVSFVGHMISFWDRMKNQ